jgi:hypothetical protein
MLGMGKKKNYGILVEHSYSDCQKVGRLAANNANTTIMTIQLNRHNQSTLASRTNMFVANMATEASKLHGLAKRTRKPHPHAFDHPRNIHPALLYQHYG